MTRWNPRPFLIAEDFSSGDLSSASDPEERPLSFGGIPKLWIPAEAPFLPAETRVQEGGLKFTRPQVQIPTT